MKTTKSPPLLYAIFLTLLAVKFEAFWRLTISSNFGCLHVPVTGVEGVDCATGVDGRVGVDIAAWGCSCLGASC